MDICVACNKNQASINLTLGDGSTQRICRNCFNALSAREMGIELAPFESGIYEYPDLNGKMHRFMVEKLVLPVGVAYEAVEVTKDDSPGYKVAIMDGMECDQEYLFYKLEAKIKYTLSKQYLKSSAFPNGEGYTGLKNDEVVGRFEYSDTGDGIHNVVIDGKVYSWEQLGRMLNTYEGFQFKLKIYDMTADV